MASSFLESDWTCVPSNIIGLCGGKCKLGTLLSWDLHVAWLTREDQPMTTLHFLLYVGIIER
jgi:hypothetical protein